MSIKKYIALRYYEKINKGSYKTYQWGISKCSVQFYKAMTPQGWSKVPNGNPRTKSRTSDYMENGKCFYRAPHTTRCLCSAIITEAARERRLLAVSYGNTTTEETSLAENRTLELQFELFFSSVRLSHFLSLTFFWETWTLKVIERWNFTLSKEFRNCWSAHEKEESISSIALNLLQQNPHLHIYFVNM